MPTLENAKSVDSLWRGDKREKTGRKSDKYNLQDKALDPEDSPSSNLELKSHFYVIPIYLT